MPDNQATRNETEADELAKQANEASRPKLEELLGTLIELLSNNDAASANNVQPLTASQFEDALQKLHDAGWSFDEQGVLRRRKGATVVPAPADTDIAEHLRERYPNLSREVSELLWAELAGYQPAPEIVGDTRDLPDKRRAVAHYMVTEELREGFYLRLCSKVSRFRNLDWEVVIKHAERGIISSPRFPYVLATLDTISDLHGEHHHQSVTFAMGMEGLQKLIDELAKVRDKLQGAIEQVQGAATPLKEGDNA